MFTSSEKKAICRILADATIADQEPLDIEFEVIRTSLNVDSLFIIQCRDYPISTAISIVRLMNNEQRKAFCEILANVIKADKKVEMSEVRFCLKILKETDLYDNLIENNVTLYSMIVSAEYKLSSLGQSLF